MEYVQNASYDSYQSVSVSIISGVGPTSLQLGLFFHQTRHRTRMQARDELSCMHRVGTRPSHRATSHHIALNITGLGIRTLLYFIIHNALQHSSSRAVAAIVGISHLPQGLKHIIQLGFVRLPPTLVTCQYSAREVLVMCTRFCSRCQQVPESTKRKAHITRTRNYVATSISTLFLLTHVLR